MYEQNNLTLGMVDLGQTIKNIRINILFLNLVDYIFEGRYI